MKPWIPGPQPIDEPSYEAIMLSLDRHLEDQDFHIHQRPLHAASLLAKAYGTTERMQMIPAPRMEDHPKYSAEYLVARAHVWYADRYGDAVKMLPEFGFFLLPLSSRIWKVRIPFFYGTASVFIDRRLGQGPKGNVILRGPIPINILDCFDGMTQPYANSLTDHELRFIQEEFAVAFDALNLIKQLDNGDPLHRQARVDYNHSVEALCGIERAYGKARRDAATCAEKTMKGLLARKNIPFKSNHDLGELARLLNSECELEIDAALANKLFTPASVSYEQVVSRQEAIESHRDLLRFLAKILNQIAQ